MTFDWVFFSRRVVITFIDLLIIKNSSEDYAAKKFAQMLVKIV